MAIMTLRKNWSVSAKNCRTPCFSPSSQSSAEMSGATSLNRHSVAAMLRWWNSSPIVMALATSTLRLTPPSFFEAPRDSTGPSTSRIQRKRSTTSCEYAPKRSTLPMPSFMVQ